MCAVIDYSAQVIMCIELDTNSMFLANVGKVLLFPGIFPIADLTAMGWY